MAMTEVDEVFSSLGPMSSERFVLSAVLDATSGQDELVFASLLAGPSAMSRLSWNDWSIHEGGRPPALASPSPATFLSTNQKVTLLRVSLTQRQARAWLDGAITGIIPPIANLPTVQAKLGSTRTAVLARPGNDNPASGFVGATERPARGFLYPIATVSPTLPDWTTVSSGPAVMTGPLLGIDLQTPSFVPRSPTQPGVFVGRLSRRAWISGITYDQANQFLNLSIRAEDADPYELEIEVREYVNGDLADTRRVRLADVPIPSRARHRLGIRLPTLGGTIERTASLYGRGGELLDEHSKFSIVFAVTTSASFNGSPPIISTIGSLPPVPTVAQALVDLRRVEQSYEQWFAQGARRRIISGIDATALLGRRLRRADGELLVIDSYFGVPPKGTASSNDWNLLKNVKVPTRVLTGKDALPPASPLPLMSAKKWTNIPIPFHDRFYLWRSAGLHVGTSPNSLGGTRAFRIDELTPAELKLLKELFERWWKDCRTAPV